MKSKDNRLHIGIFGRINNGKSSFINSLTEQQVAIVSDTAGTTSDPVKKSMEVAGLGPVVLIDTAGLDDEGDLGRKKVARTLEMIRQIDVAILLIADNTFGDYEAELIVKLESARVPFLIIHNKSDKQPIFEQVKLALESNYRVPVVDFSSKTGSNKPAVIEGIIRVSPRNAEPSLIEGIIGEGDLVLLITPIDIAAPAGRLILPQVKAIREVLDKKGVAICCRESEAENLLARISPDPKLVITDSQVFHLVKNIVPETIPLTSFSMLLARQRGEFEAYLKGTPAIDCLQEGDRVLILESCTHHVSCEDIGRVKMPGWLRKHTGKELHFDVVSGLTALPQDISAYSLVIQCGGCMITRKQLSSRLQDAIGAGVPVTNYGMAIAWMEGIYQRALAPLLQKETAT